MNHKQGLISIPVILALLALSCLAMAQHGAWDQWDPEVVRSLHTAEGVPFLTEEEQKVILFMNMARYDGDRFSESFLETWLEENKVEDASYLRSLRRDLKAANGLDPLMPEEDLSEVAQGHALTSGKSGHTVHKDINKRFAPLKGNPYVAWGENCSYGYSEAITIVMTLLIDEGIENLGHRKNILNPDFNSVGVGIRPHRDYRVNCVIDFGRKNRSSLNDLPY